MPSVEDCGAAVVTRFEQDSDWFQAENTSNFFQNRDSEMECSTDNAHEGLLSDCSQLEFHFEERTDSPTHAVSDDVASREGEQQSTEALQNESGPASTNNETNHMCFNSNTSDGEHEIRLSYIDALEGQRHHEAADTGNTNNGESCPVGASNAVTTAYDKNIEKQLQAWIATKGESQSYEEPTNVFARNYPSHEFEYWAVEVS
ncbi:uncharacterized protein EMH_0017520 [Eimeria mitis]|uniref:Uncharacterized protein n=1 Tax=Eimeria mitis TaxID=44415 RepID=U6K771_9EIME|nr:uncharacterized protein EMH_0017520 [Eimeria mitis]CDJ33819.1 hypothetical protein, conserved [Eimeria mitis]